MPELPEVETLRRELARVLPGQKIKSVQILNNKSVAPLSPKTFRQKIADHKIKQVNRRAKILLVDLIGPLTLAFHLKMTGQLIYSPKSGRMIMGGHPEDPAKYTRIIFFFWSGDKLIFNDLRKFGWARLVNDAGVKSLVEHVGVEPLSKEFSLAEFTKLLKKYPNRTVKQTLLDQSLVAGLGNIYVDESCFLAKVRPNRRIKTLTKQNITNLHLAIIKILKHSISKKGTSSRNYVRSDGSRGGFVPHLNVYGRANLPCKICSTPIKKFRHAGRGTHYCPKCQK